MWHNRKAGQEVPTGKGLPYKPEDFEVILVNFYKAMNYLQMDQMEEALVEVRKINIKLNELNDKYPDYKNRYQRDAFAHLLMGLIYEASGNYNCGKATLTTFKSAKEFFSFSE